VRDGDTLAVARQKEGEKEPEFAFVPYLEKDGESLAFRYDGALVSLGDKVVALHLAPNEEAGWKWIAGATEAQAAGVRCLTLDGKATDAQVGLLRKLAEMNPHLDLAFNEEAELGPVLPLFQPRRLLIPGAELDEAKQKLVVASTDLEALWVSAKDAKSLTAVAQLPRLRRLTLSGWQPEGPDLLPWELRNLHSLTLVDCRLKDLAALEHLAELRALRLVTAKNLADIRGLARLAKLETLWLSMESEGADFSPLSRLPLLAHLSLTVKVDDEGFASIVEAAPHVAALELIAGEGYKSLAPLKGLKELKHLVVLGGPGDMDTLAALQQLDTLMLPDEAFEKDAAAVAKLEKALPNTHLAEGHVCLGSGWLLVLLPAIAVGWFLWRRRRTVERHA